jgi:hypothetical protein
MLCYQGKRVLCIKVGKDGVCETADLLPGELFVPGSTPGLYSISGAMDRFPFSQKPDGRAESCCSGPAVKRLPAEQRALPSYQLIGPKLQSWRDACWHTLLPYALTLFHQD